MPAVDIGGERFGKLLVLERDKERKGGAAYWICKCDCGNVKSIRGTNLRALKQPTRSCGKCMTRPNSVDLLSEIGNQYGRLTVMERDLSKTIGHHSSAYWLCKCECGNLVSVAGSQLRSGKTKSCGCLKIELTKKRQILDLTGQKFGKLTAVEFTDKLSNDTSYLWKCQCECGNTIECSVEALKSNKIISCGCEKRSKGEIKIIQILEENSVPYCYQYSFSDLFGKNHIKLLYDFAILNEYGAPVRLIEFDGEQHYNPKSKYYSERTRELDNIKNNYAKQHHYPLIRIPYSELRNLSLELLLSDKYLIN